MKGWRTTRFGGPEVLEWVELDLAEPGPGEVKVRIAASGVNFAETRMLAGTYSGIDLPMVLGMESAGTVEAVGPGVTQYKVGDRVCGRARGSHAEAVIFDERLLMKLPDNLSFEEGAAIPVGWHTAWHAVVTVGKAKPGERVLVEAVASSVGSAGLQIAKSLGCWVAGTASRDDKLEKAREYGADALYNYKAGDFVPQLMEDTGGQGIDVALSTIGEETADRLLAAMGNEGRIAMYGSTGGRTITFPLAIGTRNVGLLTMSISTSPYYFTETIPRFKAEALPRFADGTYKAVVDTVLPMRDVAKAHAMIADRRHYGKVILANL